MVRLARVRQRNRIKLIRMKLHLAIRYKLDEEFLLEFEITDGIFLSKKKRERPKLCNPGRSVRDRERERARSFSLQ